AAHQLEHDVDGPGRVGDVGGEGGRVELARGEDAVVEAQRARLLELLGGSCRAHDGAAGGVAELHRGGADAGADRVHEQDLTGAQLALREERVVGGDEHLGHAAGGDEVERVGDGRALRRGDGDELGLAAATGDAEHARTERGFGDAVAV